MFERWAMPVQRAANPHMSAPEVSAKPWSKKLFRRHPPERYRWTHFFNRLAALAHDAR
jgi:hypothetical protein